MKKDLVERVERFLEQQAMSQKIRNQIQENEVIDLLSKIGNSTSVTEKIQIVRKRYADDDDDDNDDDLR